MKKALAILMVATFSLDTGTMALASVIVRTLIYQIQGHRL